MRVVLCIKLMWVSTTHVVEFCHVLRLNVYGRWGQVGRVSVSMVPTSLFHWVNDIVYISSAQNRCLHTYTYCITQWLAANHEADASKLLRETSGVTLLRSLQRQLLILPVFYTAYRV